MKIALFEPIAFIARNRLALFALTSQLILGSGCGMSRQDSLTGAADSEVHSLKPGGNPPPPQDGGVLVVPSNDRYVLEFAGTITPSMLQTLLSQYGLSVHTQEPYDSGTIALFNGPSGVDLVAVEQTLGSAVTGSSVNEPTFLSEGTSLTGGFVVGDWSDDDLATGGLEELNLPTAHAMAMGSGVSVAVIDTGLDLTHPFFASGVLPIPPGKTLVSQEILDGIDDDQDGTVDEAYGHGTHVAGIIRQVAPEAIIIPIRVLNADGVGSLWDLVTGLELARSMGADLYNLSIATNAFNEVIEAFMYKRNHIGEGIAAAAGNAGFSAPTFPGTSIYSTGIAATDAAGSLAVFSGGGPDISLAAPGVSILSAYPANQSARASGTSMATAVASGCAALVIEAFQCPPATGLGKLCMYTDPLVPHGGVSCGKINIVHALNAAP